MQNLVKKYDDNKQIKKYAQENRMQEKRFELESLKADLKFKKELDALKSQTLKLEQKIEAREKTSKEVADELCEMEKKHQLEEAQERFEHLKRISEKSHKKQEEGLNKEINKMKQERLEQDSKFQHRIKKIEDSFKLEDIKMAIEIKKQQNILDQLNRKAITNHGMAVSKIEKKRLMKKGHILDDEFGLFNSKDTLFYNNGHDNENKLTDKEVQDTLDNTNNQNSKMQNTKLGGFGNE